MLKLALAFSLGYLLRSVIAIAGNRRLAAAVKDLRQALGLTDDDPKR